MKEYYARRLFWIFHYTSKNFWYCLAKTLCLVVGLPIYAVMFCVEMVLTFINMLFSWIPVLNMVVMVVCKSLITVVGSTFYLCILPDLKKFKASGEDKVEYEVSGAADETEQIDDVNETEQIDEVDESEQKMKSNKQTKSPKSNNRKLRKPEK